MLHRKSFVDGTTNLRKFLTRRKEEHEGVLVDASRGTALNPLQVEAEKEIGRGIDDLEMIEEMLLVF